MYNGRQLAEGFGHEEEKTVHTCNITGGCMKLMGGYGTGCLRGAMWVWFWGYWAPGRGLHVVVYLKRWITTAFWSLASAMVSVSESSLAGKVVWRMYSRSPGWVL